MRFDARARFASIRSDHRRELETGCKIQTKPMNDSGKNIESKQRFVIIDESGAKFYDENCKLQREIDWKEIEVHEEAALIEKIEQWVNG